MSMSPFLEKHRNADTSLPRIVQIRMFHGRVARAGIAETPHELVQADLTLIAELAKGEAAGCVAADASGVRAAHGAINVDLGSDLPQGGIAWRPGRPCGRHEAE
jgi:hypothetical protein